MVTALMGPSGPFLFPLWKPAQDKVHKILESLRDNDFSYDADLVGATSKGPAALEPLRKKRFKIDHNRVCVGSGEAAFARAREAVKAWRHFQLGWATVDPQTPIQERARVAVLARSFGLVWTLNPLQILYVEDSVEQQNRPPLWKRQTRKLEEGGRDALGTDLQKGGRKARTKVVPGGDMGEGLEKDRFAYAHGTLKGHLLSGEERFLVEWKEDDSVWYDILAFSRPGHILTAVTYPVARFYQQEFAKQSMRAMKAALRKDPD